MPDWDADSPQLRENLTRILREIADSANRREPPTLASARHWHRAIMAGLSVPNPRYVGTFRGEAGLEQLEVRVLGRFGAPASKVSTELASFEATLKAITAELDSLLPSGQLPDSDQLAAIIDLCAWVHAEWARIHPFANGNGRIARLWANSLAMRYGLPPFVRLRPRPNTGYAEAASSAMKGDWKPTARVFHRLLDDLLSRG